MPEHSPRSNYTLIITPMKRSEPKSVNEIIEEYLNHEGLADTVDEQRAAYLWQEVVGSVINRYTMSRYVEKGVLHVYLSSAPLKQELSFCRQRLVDDLNARVGRPVLTDIMIH
jgi:predicted nucleic acid-binding Zn ribbon protein